MPAKTAVKTVELDPDVEQCRLDLEKEAGHLARAFKDYIAMVRRAMAFMQERGDKVPDLIVLYRHLYDAGDLFKGSEGGELVKEFTGLIHLTRDKLLPEAMIRDGTDTMTTVEGDRASRTAKMYASIIAENKPQAFDYLRKNNAGDLIQETVNASTLSSYAASLLEQEGKTLPDDLFRVHTKDSVSLTRGKKRKFGL